MGKSMGGGIKREALTYCTEQAGSHNSQKEKQVSTIAFVALRYFLYSYFV